MTRLCRYIEFCILFLFILAAPRASIALEVGDLAPLFSGSSNLGEIHLAEYLGKKHVVLAFYFADFTPV